ncbi:xaa-Pro aminopeptidase 1-like [Pecten maximus]|uniref:xaa-Pro aminopeptidase 1-like n=2 Tax=Pecten maximus TaxID=6579 RepID=UPI0014584FF1|nr:xaa-Pro aminopeptidase 1-like [Pecten maximus]
MAAKNTTAILARLRKAMKSLPEPVQAYIIPSGDAHQSEYIAPCDCRRMYVSGFTGSSGTAVVTETKAALWTDGRYFLQAERQMDSNWTLMKMGLTSTPSQAEWLAKELPVGGKVGVDPYLMSLDAWKPMCKHLKSTGHSMVPITQNLVDLVWDDQPDPPTNTLLILQDSYTGRKWEDKVTAIRGKMNREKCGALVVTALDEVAYLFNLRGSDIEYNPVFFSYAVLTQDSVNLFISEDKVDGAVKQHLQLNGSSGPKDIRVTVHDYKDIGKFVSSLPDRVEGKIWISSKSSYALSNSIPKALRVNLPSPIAQMKAVKNPVELKGMKRAHVKDAVTLCEFFSWLEREIPKGNITEVSAADKLEEIKRGQEDYVSLSFTTISSTGEHGAVIHYKPTAETDRQLTTEEMYLCDSGAQYKDGTTDVTRTIHFGTPSDFQKECFTRVLKGHINLSNVVFPNGVKGHSLDTLARTALWESGLDYMHGTGHGVGAFLNVHEGPCGISSRVSLTDVALEEGMILSDEPGYYEDGQFGVRIENLVFVKKAKTEYNFREKGFLTFEPLTLVPIQTKMICPSLLSEREVEWLNTYHSKVRDEVGSELRRQGKQAALDWMMRETEPLG